MQPQQKTSNKGFYAKSKSYNTQNYPYNTDETGTYHGPPYKQNNSYKYSKNKKYSNDNTNYQTSSEQYVQVGRSHTQQNENNPQYAYKEKWQHDKYNDDKQPPENTYNYPRNSRKNKNKGDSKRPDRQLYSARDKHGQTDDAKSESTNTETMTSLPNKEDPSNPESTSLNNLNDGTQEVKLIHGDAFENNESLIKTNMVKGMLGIAEDKDGTPPEEDKSFLSTVSTALSERLKNQEDENILQNKPVLPVELLPKKTEPRMLLQFIIKSEHLHEKILIPEDEEDYEGLMDKICRNHNFMGRMSLYFKINFLKMVCDQQREKTQADALLQKYVDLNAKLVLYDCRLREPHDSIKPYLVSDQFANYSMIPINAPPIQQMHQMNMRNIPGPGHMYGHMGHMKQNMNQGAM